MIKIVVADDEQQERESMCAHLRRLAGEVREELCVQTYASGSALLADYDGSADLVCLDIDMPGQDGLSVAREVRRLDRQVLILFITNLAQMAIRGYEVQALDFLVKPVSYYSFALKMKNALQMLRERKVRSIVLTTAEGKRILSTDELLYAEVRGHYLYYHTAEETIRQKATLRELEEKVEGLSFKRCNQCYLVNLKHVSAVQKDDIRIGQEWIRISRPRKKAFLQSLASYMGGVDP